MAADTVLGVFDRDNLPAALAAIHRAGFGPNARVLQGVRGDISGQLSRAGIDEPAGLTVTDDPVLVIFAPSRVAQAADLLQRSGARSIHVASRGTDRIPYAPVGWTRPQPKPRKPPVTRPNEAITDDAV